MKNINEELTNYVIHQKFSYEIFLLAVGNAVPATDLSIFYLSKDYQCQFVDIFPCREFAL